jgi:hypothetical protein
MWLESKKTIWLFVFHTVSFSDGGLMVWKYKEGVLVELEKSTLVDRLQLEIVLTQATGVLQA